GRHLPVHGVLDVLGRDDLADLDARHLHAPALGHLVQLRAQDAVDVLPLRQDVVQRDVADDCTQRGGGDLLARPGVVADGDHRRGGIQHAPVDEEVDVNGRVILGDAGLAGDFQVELAQVRPYRLVNDGD